MNKIVTYIRQVLAEVKNISWPKKDTLIQLTVVVISISIVVSSVLGGIDYLLTNSFAYLANTKNKPAVPQVQPQPSEFPAITIAPNPPSVTPTSKPVKK